jgi:CO/xanthine dehydrogenase Mo-binding subunit
LSIVGEPLIRVDAWEKVTGTSKFVDDYKFPGMLYAAVLRSPVPHAMIKAIKTDKAKALPGVAAVLTAADIPGINIVPLVLPDEPFLAEGKVRFPGEAVVAVAAETPELAEEALALLEVQYKELEPVLDIREAIKPDAVPIHESGNIYREYRVLKGDINIGFAEAEVIIEHEYHTPYQEHAYLETNGAIAVPEADGSMTIYGSMQCPFYVHDAIAQILNLPKSKVRIIQATTGGGFGGKEDVPSLVAGIAALLAKTCGRPVKYILSREEDIIAMSKRHPAIIKYKLGAKKTGELTAIEVEYLIDSGAYATLSTIVLWRGVLHAAGPYHCPNVKVIGRAVATNKVPCGAYRGFGTPQVIFAHESQMDELAHRLDMDPLELRRINALRLGEETSTGQKLDCSVGLLETMEKAQAASDWLAKRAEFAKDEGEVRRGIGVSTFLYGAGLGAEGQLIDRAGAFVQIMSDGSVMVAVGTTEMGQGMRTVLTQIAAEELGCAYEDVHILPVDTSRVPDSGPTVASRATTMSGNAIRNACQILKSRIIKVAAQKLNLTEDSLSLHNGKLYSEGREQVSYKEAVKYCFAMREHLAAQGYYKPPKTTFNHEDGSGSPYAVYSFVTDIAEVEVDTATGEVTVKKLTAAHDVGRAINPILVEGQIEGGAAQGMGYGLIEEIIQNNQGVILNPNLSTYIIPTIMDMPEVNPIIVEAHYPEGPFGAKGIGETPLMGVAAAINNAIFNALGKRTYTIPATPERILALLQPESEVKA